MPVSRGVLCGLSVVLGVVTSAALIASPYTNGAPACAAIVEACGPDGLVCVLRDFWRALSSSRQGLLGTAVVLNVAAPMVAYVALTVPPFVAGVLVLLFQLMGVSVVFPLLYIPLRAYKYRDGDAASGNAGPANAVAGVSLLFATALAMFIWVGEEPGWQLAIDAFNFSPLPIFAVLGLLARLGIFYEPDWLNHNFALMVTGGLALSVWIVAGTLFINEGYVDLAECHIAFIYLDFLSSLLSLVLLLALDGSTLSLVEFLKASLLLSPGTAFSVALQQSPRTGMTQAKSKRT